MAPPQCALQQQSRGNGRRGPNRNTHTATKHSHQQYAITTLPLLLLLHATRPRVQAPACMARKQQYPLSKHPQSAAYSTTSRRAQLQKEEEAYYGSGMRAWVRAVGHSRNRCSPHPTQVPAGEHARCRNAHGAAHHKNSLATTMGGHRQARRVHSTRRHARVPGNNGMNAGMHTPMQTTAITSRCRLARRTHECEHAAVRKAWSHGTRKQQ